MIKEDCIIHLEGNFPILYVSLKGKTPLGLLDSLKSIAYNPSLRLRKNGTKEVRRIAMIPRNGLMGSFCTESSVAIAHPEANTDLMDLAELMGKTLNKYFTKYYKLQKILLRKIKPQYRVHEVFTSGIINKNHALEYHYDKANVPNTLSCMVVKRAGVIDGELVLPEYGIALECANDSLLIFNGQKILHGVVPFTEIYSDWYRFSVVFHTAEKMKLCLEPEEELIRAQKNLRNERDYKDQ